MPLLRPSSVELTKAVKNSIKLTEITAAIVVFLSLFLSGCCAKPDRNARLLFGEFFPVPPEITTIDGGDPYKGIRPPPVADIYWDNTLSQIGYVQNKNLQIKASEEFTHFYRAIASQSVGANYRPQYHILRPNSRMFLEWTKIKAVEADPENRSFYVGSGTFENKERGPLTMLYDNNRINTQNLTIVITDLEEQGLNITLLADWIRNNLLKIDDYAAAVIAVKLPFHGKNYRPDTQNLNSMVETTYHGRKPFYAIISGPRESVKLFIRRFSEQAKNFSIKWQLMTTTQKGQRPPLDIFKNIVIPASAGRQEINKFIKSKKHIQDTIVPQQQSERSIDVQDRIWNLQERTKGMINHLGLVTTNGLQQIDTQLGARIFEYKPAIPCKKKDNWLWRLNIHFTMPEGCAIESLETHIKNYRYLIKLNSSDDEVLPKWEANEMCIDNDLEAVQPVLLPDLKTVQIAVLPGNEDKLLTSPVICFDVIVRIKEKIEIPAWTADFDAADYKNPKEYQDRTLNFGNFIKNLLKGEAIEAIAYSNDELMRMPVVLFNMPSRMKKSKTTH